MEKSRIYWEKVRGYYLFSIINTGNGIAKVNFIVWDIEITFILHFFTYIQNRIVVNLQGWSHK